MEYGELFQCGGGTGDDMVKRVKITKIPMGSAQERVRSAWLVVEIFAIRLPLMAGSERDFMTGQTFLARMESSRPSCGFRERN